MSHTLQKHPHEHAPHHQEGSKTSHAEAETVQEYVEVPQPDSFCSVTCRATQLALGK